MDDDRREGSVLASMLQEAAARQPTGPRTSRAVDLRFCEAGPRFVWIVDGDRRIGLIDREGSTLEWIAPHPEVASIRPPELPAVYHAPTWQGGRVVLQWWLESGGSWRREASEPLVEPIGMLTSHEDKARGRSQWSLGAESGERLTFRAVQSYDGDDRVSGEHRGAITYDPVADSYILDVRARLTAPDLYFAEFCNVLAGGVYDNRPAHKRYQCTLWSHPEAGLLRWHHNPVGYLTPGMNNVDGQRRVGVGGFIGYFCDPLTNPVVELLESSHPVATATCCNLYDEHMICQPRPEQVSGPFRWDVRYRFLSLQPEIASEIVARSKLIDLQVDPSIEDTVLNEPDRTDDDLCRLLHHPTFPGFHDGCINDFEEPIPCDGMQVASMVWASGCPDNDVYWDPACGHSGKRSIRLRSTDEAKGASTMISGGPTPHVSANTRYRLSGWIRCLDVTGRGARIRFDEIGFSRADDQNAVHVAGPVTGTCDWQYVDCVFTTGPTSDLGWLYLELEGAGQAWFDDIALEQMERI